MAKSWLASLPAILDNVRRWPVEDFCSESRSGAVKWAVEWRNEDGLTESDRPKPMPATGFMESDLPRAIECGRGLGGVLGTGVRPADGQVAPFGERVS